MYDWSWEITFTHDFNGDGYFLVQQYMMVCCFENITILHEGDGKFKPRWVVTCE